MLNSALKYRCKFLKDIPIFSVCICPKFAPPIPIISKLKLIFKRETNAFWDIINSNAVKFVFIAHTKEFGKLKVIIIILPILQSPSFSTFIPEITVDVIVYHVTIIAIGHGKFCLFGNKLRSTHCRELEIIF